MPIVRTVTGDVDTPEIGRTSMHDHLLYDFDQAWFVDPQTVPTIRSVDPNSKVGLGLLGAIYRNPNILHDNLCLDDEDLAAEELEYFREEGGDCIVEVTNVGIHPNPEGLLRVAERTGLHIVAGSGFYIEASHPGYVATESEEQLAARIINDLTVGVDGTEVKAGIIGEIGTSTVTPQEAKVLRACAQAQLATGAAISLHTEYECREGEQIVKLLGDQGVQPERVIVGHMDENLVAFTPAPTLAYLDYHRQVLDLGAWVQYDTFGSEWYMDDAENTGLCEPRDTERVAGLATLISEGYTDQLLVGEDIWTKHALKRYGGWGYDHILRVVPSMLRRVGVSDDAIEQILIHNPRRALAMSA
jgi:phosphotriesterase-related protein